MRDRVGRENGECGMRWGHGIKTAGGGGEGR